MRISDWSSDCALPILNGIGRTGFFAKTAVNAAGEIDSEKFRIAPAVFVFSGLQGNAIDRTGGGTEVTSYTAFTHVWVTGEYDPAPPSCLQGCFLFGDLNSVVEGKSW